MFRMIRTVAGLAMAGLLLAGCSTQSLDAGRAAQYKRVGVLSAMGDTFMSGRVGVTILTTGSALERLDLGADEAMTEAAMAALSARYQVVDLGRYRQAFLDQPKYWPGDQQIVGETRPAATEVVRSLMGGEKLDAYILLTPATASVRGTNRAVGGIGLVKKEELLRTGDVLLHVAYIVSVVDGIDFSLQADMRAFPNGESPLASLVGGSQLGAPNWPVLPAFQEDPAAYRTQMASVVKMLVAQNVPQTLRQARLID